MALARALVAVLVFAANTLTTGDPEVQSIPDSRAISVRASSPSLKAKTEDLKNSLLRGEYTTLQFPQASRDACPSSCSSIGVDPVTWPAYHSFDRIGLSQEALLLNFALSNLLEDPSTHVNIQACTSDYSMMTTNTSASVSQLCIQTGRNHTEVTKNLQLASPTSGSNAT